MASQSPSGSLFLHPIISLGPNYFDKWKKRPVQGVAWASQKSRIRQYTSTTAVQKYPHSNTYMDYIYNHNKGSDFNMQE